MNPGLITFNQIINDSLMPWLSTFGDEKKLRKLIIYIDNNNNTDKTNFFKSLLNNMNQMDIMVKNVIYDDWKYLSKYTYEYKSDTIYLINKQIVWKENIIRFYVNLLINCGLSHLYWLKENISKEDDEKLIRYKVMRSLMDCGQLIIDCNKSSVNDKNALDIMYSANMILAFMWLKILRTYNTYVDMSGLPILKEEVIHNLIYQNERSENINLLRETILGDLMLKEKKVLNKDLIFKNDKAAEDLQNYTPDLNKIKDEFNSDLDLVKDEIENIEIKNDNNFEFVKPKEATEILNISNSTLNEWRKKGKFKYCKSIQNRFEYNKTELIKLKTQMDEKDRRVK